MTSKITISAGTPIKWLGFNGHTFSPNNHVPISIPADVIDDIYDASGLRAFINNENQFTTKIQYLGYLPVCASCKYSIYCLSGQYPNVCSYCRGLLKVYNQCPNAAGLPYSTLQLEHIRTSLEKFRVSSACPLLRGNTELCRLCGDQYRLYVNKIRKISTVRGKLLFNRKIIKHHKEAGLKHQLLAYVRRSVKSKGSDSLHQRQEYRYFKKHKR